MALQVNRLGMPRARKARRTVHRRSGAFWLRARALSRRSLAPHLHRHQLSGEAHYPAIPLPADMTERIDASPTKGFFISMITRDISLTDCILDLLDNSLDGAKASTETQVAATGTMTERRDHALDSGPSGDDARKLRGYSVDITMTRDRFAIEDNCGGMPIDVALHYAFHFGRPAGDDSAPSGGIGLYGIGMKRAMFKIGRQIVVQSSTVSEGFDVLIDVNEWAQSDRWEFPLERRGPAATAGVSIEITDLVPSVADEMGDSTFIESVIRTVARDYSFFIADGFTVRINGEQIAPTPLTWLEGDDIHPARLSYSDPEDPAVSLELIAGLSTAPPDEEAPEDLERVDTSRFGWFVACNGRVVLAGNKDSKTIWGDEGFNVWHPQYNGFTGVVHFRCDDPGKLPWTTTKRDVDPTSSVYRRAIDQMKRVTRPFIEYSNRRRADLDAAKAREREAEPRPAPAEERAVMRLPAFTITPAAPRLRVANIAYSVPLLDFQRVAEALGSRAMTRKDVGIRTFEYFRTREVETEE
jgi:hypothetical protein